MPESRKWLKDSNHRQHDKGVTEYQALGSILRISPEPNAQKYRERATRSHTAARTTRRLPTNGVEATERSSATSGISPEPCCWMAHVVRLICDRTEEQWNLSEATASARRRMGRTAASIPAALEGGTTIRVASRQSTDRRALRSSLGELPLDAAPRPLLHPAAAFRR
jgi:hypothetical protein